MMEKSSGSKNPDLIEPLYEIYVHTSVTSSSLSCGTIISLALRKARD
jgi:hypothetical protein